MVSLGQRSLTMRDTMAAAPDETVRRAMEIGMEGGTMSVRKVAAIDGDESSPRGVTKGNAEQGRDRETGPGLTRTTGGSAESKLWKGAWPTGHPSDSKRLRETRPVLLLLLGGRPHLRRQRVDRRLQHRSEGVRC